MNDDDDGLNAARGMFYAVPIALAVWSVFGLALCWYAYPEKVAQVFDGALRLVVVGS